MSVVRRIGTVAATSAVIVLSATGSALAAAPTSSLDGCGLLLEGDSGECVATMQTELDAVNPDYGLTADGVFGPATRIALLDFQGRNQLGADGNAGSETLGLLQQQYDALAPAPAAAPAPPELTDMEICEALGGDLWIPDGDGGCVPDAAIPLGKSALECGQEAVGKKVISEFRTAWAEKGAEEAAAAGAKEGAKSLAKKLAAVPGIFKCMFWDR